MAYDVVTRKQSNGYWNKKSADSTDNQKQAIRTAQAYETQGLEAQVWDGHGRVVWPTDAVKDYDPFLRLAECRVSVKIYLGFASNTMIVTPLESPPAAMQQAELGWCKNAWHFDSDVLHEERSVYDTWPGDETCLFVLRRDGLFFEKLDSKADEHGTNI